MARGHAVRRPGRARGPPRSSRRPRERKRWRVTKEASGRARAASHGTKTRPLTVLRDLVHGECCGMAPAARTSQPEAVDAAIHEALDDGDRRRARRLAKELLGQEPGNPAALGHLADLAVRSENWPVARKYLELALAAPAASDAWFGEQHKIVSDILHDLGRTSWSRADVNELTWKLEFAIDEDWPRLARYYFDRLRAVAPEAPERFFLEGRIAEKLGEWREAERLYRRAATSRAARRAARLRLAFVLLRQERFEEAANEYRSIVAAAPGLLPAWHNLGACYSALGDREKALGCWDRALAINPRYYMAWVSKAQVLAASGRRKEASRCLSKAMRFNPDYAMAALAAPLLETAGIVHRSGMLWKGDRPG